MYIREQKYKRSPTKLFNIIKVIYSMCYKANPTYYVLTHIMGVLYGISDAVNVMIMQMLFDSVYDVSIGEREIDSIIISFLIYIVFYYINDILHAVGIFMRTVQRSRILGYMNCEISRKSALIDPIEYENPRYIDDISKATNGAQAAIQFEFSTVGIFAMYFPYFFIMGFYMYRLKPMLIFSILFVFLPVAIGQMLRSSVFSNLEDEITPIKREFNAYINATCGKNFSKETRNLGSFAYFRKLLVNTINLLNKSIWNANKRSVLIDLGFNTLHLIGYGGILFLLIKYLLNGEISIGAFAAVYSSIERLFFAMEQIIEQHFGRIADTFGQIRNFIEFLNIPTDNREKVKISKKASIVLENVSFKYPNSEKYSLKNINLNIKPGETIAIVGENGAGKTTLVKLIIGLYEPTKGSIKIGKVDLKKACYSSRFENISGVFQNFQKYALTLRENIQIANFNDISDDDKIKHILEKTHINKDDINLFPNGLDTMLSREFDGTDLSMGLWQRIAIARGLYRKSDIIVLDEPTASIDPIEESAIYHKFVDISKNKTAIIITHRMGTAKIANRIVVMKNGEIVEIGCHDELLKSNGIYANMYTAQSKWYQ